jgi:hypothetical protein
MCADGASRWRTSGGVDWLLRASMISARAWDRSALKASGDRPGPMSTIADSVTGLHDPPSASVMDRNDGATPCRFPSAARQLRSDSADVASLIAVHQLSQRPYRSALFRARGSSGPPPSGARGERFGVPLPEWNRAVMTRGFSDPTSLCSLCWLGACASRRSSRRRRERIHHAAAMMAIGVPARNQVRLRILLPASHTSSL